MRCYRDRERSSLIVQSLYHGVRCHYGALRYYKAEEQSSLIVQSLCHGVCRRNGAIGQKNSLLLSSSHCVTEYVRRCYVAIGKRTAVSYPPVTALRSSAVTSYGSSQRIRVVTAYERYGAPYGFEFLLSACGPRHLAPQGETPSPREGGLDDGLLHLSFSYI